ncbi:MAG: DUF934 domain-containing protein [Betaproteobacteria bacterium]|jgi:uncharacterized protein (DUF934 family)|nr:DUF934 domain-containing protein [Betaproteobacteria bacterium]NBT66903.1 DUF934 domain-containing protein [Betaproteobacteria bacterium]NBY08813.1 DUF934 domain-containing protein [Betaproteobacteria bacterium]
MMKLNILTDQGSNDPLPHSLRLPNEANPLEFDLSEIKIIELNFPKFTDGRAYSQAMMLRRRVGFDGDIRATGDVLVDQLAQMARTGFTSAILRSDQDRAVGEKLLNHFTQFYQGDVVQPKPAFAR